MVVVAGFAEKIAAALELTISTDRSSAVDALGDDRFAAQCSVVAAAREVFDLTVTHVPPPHRLIRNNASQEQVPSDTRAQINLHDLPSGNSYESDS